MATLATLALCTVVAYLVFRALDTGAPAGWYLTLPRVSDTLAPAPAYLTSAMATTLSGTCDSDRPAPATESLPAVVTELPCTCGAPVAPRADVRCMVEALPVVETRVGVLCYQLDATIDENTSTDTSWTLCDRFTGAPKARVAARIVRGRDGRRGVQVTAEVL